MDEKANKLFDDELKKTYDSVVEKAKLLIKLQVPATLLKLNSQAPERKLEKKRTHIMVDRQ